MSPAKPANFALIATLSFLTCVADVSAQSGRRLPRSQPITDAATKEAEGRNATVPAVRALPRQVKLLVGKHSTSRHLPSEDTIYASFLKRLNEFRNVIGTSMGEVSRKNSTRRARAEAESLVVFLQFEIDSIQDGKVVFNSSDLVIKYFVFEPVTGKEITHAKVYYRAIGGAGSRRANWPTGPPVKITAEAAGIEAAERLHDWLLIAGVPVK